jgi:hypothetical protein
VVRRGNKKNPKKNRVATKSPADNGGVKEREKKGDNEADGAKENKAKEKEKERKSDTDGKGMGQGKNNTDSDKRKGGSKRQAVSCFYVTDLEPDT